MKLENFSNYEIYPEEGKIWSYKTNRFIGAQQQDGYWRVGLIDDNGKQKNFLLHRLIWTAVHGEIPQGMEINHTTEDKSMNGIQFLELVTHKDNLNYGTRTAKAAESMRNGKLSKQVAAYKDGVLAMTFPSTQEAERQGFDHGHISDCCNGKLKSHRGYTWIYFEDFPPLFI